MSDHPTSTLRGLSTKHDASRIEAQLRHENAAARTRALDHLTRGSPAARAALLTRTQSCDPILLGTLLELKAGGAPTAATVKHDAVRRLGLVLGSRDRLLRRAARNALVHGNVSLDPARPALVQWSRDPRAVVRRAVADVCGEMFWGGGLRTSDVGLVERLLADPLLRFTGFEAGCHILARTLALLTAELAKPDGKCFLDRLPRASRRSLETYSLSESIRGLGALGAELVRALGDGNPSVRAHGARSLGIVTATAAPSIHALLLLLGDRDSDVSNEAQRALDQLRQHIVLPGPAVLRLCRSIRPHARANAVRCLPIARVERTSMWDAFERALDDQNEGVRVAALETLRHTARDVTDGVMARLIPLAGPRSRALLRMNAAHTLAHFAADPRAALETLRRGLRARDATTRKTAAAALDCVGGRNTSPARKPRPRRG